MALDPAEPLDRIEEPRLAADGEIEPNRLSPSVTMSRPAASCALMTAATASRYCSRNIESPTAALNDWPRRFTSYHSGRGYDPVIAVVRGRSRVTRNIRDAIMYHQSRISTPAEGIGHE
jgi:hypothetical protein